MTAYYNEFEPDTAAWLRELIEQGLIADGDVDERSILDVRPEDLKGYTQCHFFAGIGGWSYGLRLAGWPDDEPVWTGSPPCQPFSNAGMKKGKEDERHLSPHFISLVRSCRPELLFGEQVASANVFGKAAKPSRKQSQEPPEWAWLDDLSDRLEAAHYALGAVDFPSASVGAPHIRQRTYFGAVRLADCCRERLERYREPRSLNDEEGRKVQTGYCSEGSKFNWMGNANEQFSDIDALLFGQESRRNQQDCAEASWGSKINRPNASDSFWDDVDWIGCRDGKWRPVEPGTSPLANGVSARMLRLRGYGNAINPHQAATFIKAFIDSL